MNRAYIAGFVDGEGCIGFSKCRNSIFPRVLVTNTNREILEELQRAYGGDISPLSLRKTGWKQGWSWRLSWSAAVSFLDDIAPWLRLKLRQADTIFAWNAIRLRRGKATKSKRTEYEDSIELLLRRMTWLNAKGNRIGDDPINEVLVS